MKRSIAAFEYEAVSLRLIKECDLATTLSWRNRDEARIWFKTTTLITYEQHLGWFNRYLEKDDDFLFVVESAGKLVGQAAIYDIQWDAGSAEIGRFLVAPDSSGKGIITSACAALIRFCTESFKLQYLFLEVLESNDRAIRLYQRNGFVEERRYDGLVRMGLSLDMLRKA